MVRLSFKELVERILKEEKKPLTTYEIWQAAVRKGYDKLVGSKGKTPWNTIGARIYVDMKENPNSLFIKVGTRPVRFTLKNMFSEKQLEKFKTTAEVHEKTVSYSERDLHSFLTYFARMYLKVYTKTIYHERSQKKRFSQWLHPDMVGVCFRIGVMKCLN